jgi:hypothetical protein
MKTMTITRDNIVVQSLIGVQFSLIGRQLRRREFELISVGDDVESISSSVKLKSPKVEIIPARYGLRKGFIWRYPGRPDILFLPPKDIMVLNTNNAVSYDEHLLQHHLSIALSILKSIGHAQVQTRDEFVSLDSVFPRKKMKMPKETAYT